MRRLQEEDVLTKYLDSNHFHQRRPQTLAEVFWNRKKWAPWENVHLQIGHRGQAVFTCDCLFHYLMLNCQGGISVWMYLYLVFSIIVLVFHFCIRYFVFDADLSWRDFRLAVAGVERGEGFDCWLKIKKFMHIIGLKIYNFFFHFEIRFDHFEIRYWIIPVVSKLQARDPYLQNS